MPRGRRVGILIKGAVSAGLLAFLLSRIDLVIFVRLWGSARLPFLVFSVFLYIVAQLLSTWRWQVLLLSQGIRVPTGRLLVLYLEGMFFNLFLPTLIGGDVVRGYRIYALTNRSEAALASVLVDRLAGFAGLLCIALLALGVGYPALRDPQIPLLIGGAALAFGGLIAALGSDGLKDLFFRALTRYGLGRFTTAFRPLYEALHRYRGHGKALLAAFAISLVLQAAGILVFYLVARGLNVPVALRYCFLLLPLVIILAMLPVSIAGLGVREGGAVYLFGKVGVDAASALGISLGWFAVTALTSSLGGLAFALGGGSPWPFRCGHRDKEV